VEKRCTSGRTPDLNVVTVKSAVVEFAIMQNLLCDVVASLMVLIRVKSSASY
jgi:hypothetical protein